MDFLSEGRVVLGAGFGWNLEELADHGIPPRRRRTALREYLAAMQALWSEDEASYDGEFVRFGPSWAWPKPAQRLPLPVLIGGFGNHRLFDWIAESAHGWITTPAEERLDDSVRLLRERWSAAGRAHQPRVVVLGGRADEQALDRWAELGVDEVLFGLPDADEGGCLTYLDRLASRVAAHA